MYQILIDLLVLNAKFSSISAISWRYQILYSIVNNAEIYCIYYNIICLANSIMK